MNMEVPEEGEFAKAVRLAKLQTPDPEVKTHQKAKIKDEGRKVKTVKKLKEGSRAKNFSPGADAGAEVSEDDATPTGGRVFSTKSLAKARATLLECLGAEKQFWDKDAKAYVTVPDYAARVLAANSIIHHEIGKPIERQQIDHRVTRTVDDKFEELKRSPEAIRVLVAGGAMTKEDGDAALASIRQQAILTAGGPLKPAKAREIAEQVEEK